MQEAFLMTLSRPKTIEQRRELGKIEKVATARTW